MSRIPKWKLEKTKVKVVFRLQFHATHIPHTGWDKLFVSFIPDETGRVTAKTNKANVRNSTCKWADPIYETTRLVQDTSAKKYEDKFYKLVVAMGTSRSSFLGETYINLADYVDALKPVSVALPLEGSDYGTILHVSVQLLTSKTGFREFEQQRETREKVINQISSPSPDPVRKQGDYVNRITDKANARVRFSQESAELYSVEEMDEFEDSATGMDGSSCNSDTMYAEKTEISSTHGSDTLKNITNQHAPAEISIHDESPHRLLVHGWSSDFSVDNKLSSLYEENTKMRGCLEMTESSVLEMKMEVNSLQHLAEELGIETQRLTRQFTSELTSGEALFEEVSVLKSECSKLKDEFEVLRHYKRMLHLNGRRTENSHNPDAFPGMKEWSDKPENQSQCLEGLTLLEKKIRILRSKLQVRCHENGVDFITDFEGIDFVLQNLKQRVLLSSSANSTQGTGIKHVIPLQTLLDQELENKKIMNERICGLLTELEESKTELENLTRKMNQKVLHYDALILKMEERNLQTLSELEIMRVAHSSSLSKISVLQSEIEEISHSTNKQFVKLSEEKRYLESVNEELEKRVTTSEAVLKRIRSAHSSAVDRLQKDLELLSAQVLSVFETNEDLAKKALAEVPKLLGCDKPKFLQDPHPDFNAAEEISRKLGNYESPQCKEVDINREEELSLNLHLEVLVQVLRETLVEKKHLEREMKAKIDELSLSEGSLMLKLQDAFGGISVLVAEKNILEAKSQDAYSKTSSLTENLEECKRQIADLKIIERRCTEEKSALESLLKEESLQKSCLEGKLYDHEKNFDLLRDKLRIMCSNMEPYISHMNRADFNFSSVSKSLEKEVVRSDYLAAVSHLEQLQRGAFKEILKLNEEMNERETEKDSLRVLLQEKCSHLEEITSKLDISTSLAGKLQLDLQAKAEYEQKLINLNKDLSSKLTIMEYKLQDAYAEMGVFSKTSEELEGARQIITNYKGEKENLELSLQSTKKELKSERETKAKLEETLTHLTSQLREKDDKVIHLESEKSSLENLLWQHEEHQRNLDDEIAHLTFQLKEKCELILSLDELDHLRQRIIHLETSKSAAEKQAIYLDTELCKARERLGCARDELHSEREIRAKLEVTISDFSNIREQILTLESDKSAADELLMSNKERISELGREISALHSQLQSERDVRNLERTLELSEKESRERKVSELTSLLNQKDQELISLEQNVSEKQELLVLLRSDNSELHSLLLSAEIQGTVMEERWNEFHNCMNLKEMETCKLLLEFEEEMERERSSKEEHEIVGLVLQSKLYEQHEEIMRVLSEQILKTEEIKNLYVRLTDQIKEKREKENTAPVESLRVAFIKEQCEMKVQELQTQLDFSKKHGEDLLLKLQAALDEIDLRKKCEASLARRNEELLAKVLELESTRREFVTAYDEIKAELECSIISAECCKEEKSEAEASLRECTQEVEKLRSQLEMLTSKNLEERDQQASVTGNASSDHMAELDDQRREQEKLRGGIERLKQELERMKMDDLDRVPADGQELLDPSLRGLEKEILQLELANRNLATLFPSFQELPENGNALERVLALELELAEALQTKKKSEIVFQSSFLRQLGDEAAILRSFKDINELMGEMLDMKGRHAAMESELSEMHRRFSQLSLQLAEAEGERQKLLMMLKNSRSPSKP